MHLEASSKITIKGSLEEWVYQQLFSEIVTPVLTSNHRFAYNKTNRNSRKYKNTSEKRSITRIEMPKHPLF